MDAKEFLNIRIDIAGKAYGLRINREEEELARKAAKQIKTLSDQYQMKYPKSADDKDWLAMAALQLSIDNLQLRERNDVTPFVEKIRQVTNLLETYIEEN
jgi:cell division protein ZapA